MEDKSLFQSFKYIVGNDFIYKDKVEVKVFYIYKYKNVIKTIDIKKIANGNELYYQNEAKKVVNQLIKNGELLKFTKKFLKLKTAKLVFVPVAISMALAGIGVGAAYTVEDLTTPSYTVTFDSNGGSAVPSQTVKRGSHAKSPDTAPTKSSVHDYRYEFECWKDESGNQFEFNITPITCDITLRASWKTIARTYHFVSFDTDGGEPAIDPIEVEHGFTMVPPETVPEKPITPQYSYTFEEWQLNGATFDFINTPITTDGITLKAKYTPTINKYTVTIDSKNGEDSVVAVVEYGSLVPEEYRPKEVPTREDKYRPYIFDGWHKVTTSGMEDEEFDFNNERITEDILIEAKWEGGESKIYTLTTVGDPDQKLWFGESRDEPITEMSIEAGKTFSIFVFAQYGTEYKVPDMVDVYVGDSEVPLKNYVDYIREFDERAEIRINGNAVCDNLRIEATPIKDHYYSIEINNYGVKHDCTASEWKTAEDLVIQFDGGEQDYDLPTKENFCVKFDDGEWGKLSNYSEICTYDETNYTLTVHQYKVYRNMAVKVRSPYPSYNLLEDLTWKQIKDISESGWATDTFYLGEEKTVEVNGIGHKTRIIGFNHDTLSSDTSKKAVITFEFINVITNENGVEKISWNNDAGEDSRNYNFTVYTLNKYLNKDNNCLFKRLPDELQKAIKTVKKDICTFGRDYTTDNPYNTKLFPLSYYEMTASVPEWSMREGNQYEYWKYHTSDADRIKTAVGKTNGYNYWMRSPYTGFVWFAFYVKSDGTTKNINRLNVEYGVAPAFCI